MKSINVKNVRLAELTITKAENGTRTFTYTEPELVAGVMKINQVPTTSTGEMYEDGKKTEDISQIIAHELAMDFGRFPNKWRSYIKGLTYEEGVLSDDGPCTPKPFAMGFEVEYIQDGTAYRELTWYLHCQAKHMEKNAEQRKKDITFSNDTVAITAFKDAEVNDRAYVTIDTADSEVTEEMITNFFTKVQTSRTITAKA